MDSLKQLGSPDRIVTFSEKVQNWTKPLPNWMDDMLDGIEDAVNEVLPEPEQEAVVCYSQACQRGMEDRGIPWKHP